MTKIYKYDTERVVFIVCFRLLNSKTTEDTDENSYM